MLIVDAMKNYGQEVHPKGEMLSDNQRVFRVEVLKTGVPLHKMDDFVNYPKKKATVSHPRPTCDS